MVPAAVCAAIGALLAVPAGASAHSSFVTAGPAAAPFASAAAVIGGARWPGSRTTYFNASEAKWHVAQAVKAWNSSGARVRFVPVPRRRAQIVISDSPTPRSDNAMAGFATLGYVYPGGGYVKLSRLEHPQRPNYSMAGVATHELGHVLGLAHEDDSCATMNTSLWAQCTGARPCRLLEQDDIRGATRLYGGRVRMTRPGFCPKPPSRIRATGDPNAYGVTLEWRKPRGPFSSGVHVARGKGKCPRRPPSGSAWRPPVTGTRFVDRDFSSGTRLLTGRYCYALWGAGDQSMASSRRTLWVDFKPARPAAPTDLRAVVGPAGAVSLTWAVAAHPEVEGVEGSAARGRCPTDSRDGDHWFEGDGTRSSVDLATPGRYCFAAWTRDSVGALSGPATIWVTRVGSPPDADFTYFNSSYYSPEIVEFSDGSWDPDGEEIVSRRWDFGDGNVLEGNQPNPVHTFPAFGTYNVRLTVTDAEGLTGAITIPVTVSDPGTGFSEK
jgi:hypothetical protein